MDPDGKGFAISYQGVLWLGVNFLKGRALEVLQGVG